MSGISLFVEAVSSVKELPTIFIMFRDECSRNKNACLVPNKSNLLKIQEIKSRSPKGLKNHVALQSNYKVKCLLHELVLLQKWWLFLRQMMRLFWEVIKTDYWKIVGWWKPTFTDNMGTSSLYVTIEWEFRPWEWEVALLPWALLHNADMVLVIVPGEVLIW